MTMSRVTRYAARLALTSFVVGLASLATVAWAADAPVGVLDNRYDPSEVSIVTGDTVTWSWRGDNPHSVTSSNGAFADSHPGCSPATPGECGTAGAVHTVRFDQPGTYDYFCKFHGVAMAGRVIVQAPPEPEPEPEPSSEPEPEPEPEPSSEPEPEPSPEPEPQPEPSSEPPPPPPSPAPQPEPPARSEPAPSETSPSPAPSPSPTPELEAFPSPSTPDEDEEPQDVGEVAVDLPDDTPPGRVPALVVASVSLVGTVGAFARLILFGEPWQS